MGGEYYCGGDGEDDDVRPEYATEKMASDRDFPTQLRPKRSVRQKHEDALVRAQSMSQVENVLHSNGLRYLVPIMQEFDIHDTWALQVAMKDGELDHLCSEDRRALWEAFDKRSDPVFDKTMRVVADGPWANIAFPRWIWSQVIDTPPFQRLRGLRQMGNTHFIYPEANGTRFQHSLGVGHLARDWCSVLGQKLNIDGHAHWQEAIRDTVTIAGLCHDLGHGPLSHAFESMIDPNLGKLTDGTKWTHESMSVKIFEYMCDNQPLGETMDYLGTREMVKDVIRGEKKTEQQNRFADDPVAQLEAASRQIVANKCSGCDVDRFDYIVRDSLVAHGLSTFRPYRLINHSRIIDNEIVFRHAEFRDIFTFYHSRYELFTKVYTHPKNQGVDHMYADILRLTDKVFGFSESISDVERFLTLTDASLSDWLNACTHLRSDAHADLFGEYEADFQKAEKILDRLKKRDLYRFAGEVQILPGFGKERLHDMQKIGDEIFAARTSTHLRRDDIIASVTHHDYGAPDSDHSGTCSPWDSVQFYKKDKDEIVKLPEASRTNFPSEWSRDVLRFFTRDRGQVDALEAAVVKWASGHDPNELAETPMFSWTDSGGAPSPSNQSPSNHAISPASSYWLSASGRNAGKPTRILEYNEVFSLREGQRCDDAAV